jgi:predicted negative regulator of RcsB-dependent stress response
MSRARAGLLVALDRSLEESVARIAKQNLAAVLSEQTQR